MRMAGLFFCSICVVGLSLPGHTFGQDHSSVRTWSVAEEPVLELGGNDPREEYTFHQVGEVFFLSSDMIAVVDIGDMVIKLFDIEGNYVRAIGGKGQGPGEFQVLSQAGRTPEGGIWAWDSSLYRITRFTVEGEVLSTAAVNRSIVQEQIDGRIVLRRVEVIGALPDDHMVMELTDQGTFRLQRSLNALPAHTPIQVRDTVDYVLVDSVGEPIQTLAQIPGREWVHWRDGDTGRIHGSTGSFTPNAYGTISRNRLIVGSTSEQYLAVVDMNGDRISQITIPAERQRVSREVLERARANAAGKDPSGTVEIPVREIYPLYGDLKTGPEEQIWVRLRLQEEAEVRRWLELSEDGTLRRVVETPAITLQDLSRDHIIVRSQNDFDLDVITVYRLAESR